MTSYLTDAANAVARDPNKPTVAEIGAYLNSLEAELLALPDTEYCVGGYSPVAAITNIMGNKSFVWQESLEVASAGAKYTTLAMATNFDPLNKKGHIISIEVLYPIAPTSQTLVEIKTNFSGCRILGDGRFDIARLGNDEARYVNVRGTWSERAEVLKEFARLLIEFGSPAVSKALRPIEVPVNALEDALKAQPR